VKDRLVSRVSWRRYALGLLAVWSLVACVSGSTDVGGSGGDSATTGGAGPSGGNTATGGGTAQGGAVSNGGSTVVPQGGSTTNGGSMSMGGAGGMTMVPLCNFPTYVPKKPYVTGDKVMYDGKAYIASHDNPDGATPVVSPYYWDEFACQMTGTGGMGGTTGVSGSTGMGGSTGDPNCPLAKYLPQGQATFDNMFQPPWAGHVAKSLYSYSALCTALKTTGFTSFANSGNADTDKREIAAFFAHVAKETAFLEQTDEAMEASNAQDYHGRGAIQITGQSNYAAAGQYLGKDLVGNPGLVSTDPVTNWQSALWFWMVNYNPGTAGVQNCHQAMGTGDFAQTTRIINGGIECPGSQSAMQRAGYFTNNCSTLSVSPGTQLVC